jgi:hypothetical protein
MNLNIDFPKQEPRSTGMNASQIKEAINNGHHVFWCNDGYEVIMAGDEFLIYCNFNDSCIGLTHRDGVTLNGDETDFYIKD